MYRMYLVLGDWSDDGHGKCDKVLVETNHPVEVVQQAYRDSCKLTGVEFNWEEDYTERGRQRASREVFQIAVQYGHDLTFMSDAVHQILMDLNPPEDVRQILDGDLDNPTEDFTTLWFWFVSLSLPDLIVNKVTDQIPCINGYWGDLNVCFGYGLYD